jgi:hypothetical protein
MAIFTNCNKALQTLPLSLNLYSTKPILLSSTEITLKKTIIIKDKENIFLELKGKGTQQTIIENSDFKNFIVIKNSYVSELILSDITFKNIKDVISIKQNTSIKKLIIKNCEFIGCQSVLNTDKDVIIEHLSFSENIIDGNSIPKNQQTTSQKGIFAFCQVNNAEVTGNIIKNLTGTKGTLRAIHIGKTDTPAQHYLVANNNICNITGGNPGEQQGIMTLGKGKSEITNNILENIYHTIPQTPDVEGIYSKSTLTIIQHNTLRNCGDSEGAIVVKGKQSNLSKTIINNNQISFSLEHSLNRQTAGIRVSRTNNVSIISDNIENSGFKNGAINLGAGFNEHIGRMVDNIQVKDNKITFNNARAIRVTGEHGGKISIVNNSLEYVKNSLSPNIVYGIEIKTVTKGQASQLKEVTIKHNEIKIKPSESIFISINAQDKQHNIMDILIEDNIFFAQIRSSSHKPVTILGKIEQLKTVNNKIID